MRCTEESSSSDMNYNKGNKRRAILSVNPFTADPVKGLHFATLVGHYGAFEQ